MPVRLGIVRAGERSARDIAAQSRAALDRPLAHAAELWVAISVDEAVLIGAFQRGAAMPADWPLLRRGSGGPEVRVGPSSVHVALTLAHPGAIVPCDEKRIVNRYVRPLLRALTRTGSLAHFFGRDWISVRHHPVGWVGFAHDAATHRTLFEAFVGVRTPFALTDRPSFLGKPASTLHAVRERPLEAEYAPRLAGAIADAYIEQAGGEAADLAPPAFGDTAPLEDLRADPPWAATGEEAIGTLGAGPDAHGDFRVGGDLLVSRDALAQLEARLHDAPDGTSPAMPERGRNLDEDLSRIVDETLGGRGVALDGVKSLASVRDVIARARGAGHG